MCRPRSCAPGARRDHPAQEGGAVLAVAQVAVQHLQDVQADVQTDVVRQLQGPMGWRSPSFITWSMVSLGATPSSRAKQASLSIGSRMRLATKPG